MGNITLKEIAKEAGVSQATVSFVINGNDRVSEESRRKVLTAIEKLNYSPSGLGQALKKKHSNLILFAVGSENTNPVVQTIFDGVSKQSIDMGFYPVFLKLDSGMNDYIENFFSYKPSGIISLALPKQLISKMMRFDTTLAIIERPDDMPDIDYIGLDNFRGGYLAARHLVENGHRKICCITGPALGILEKDRVNGAKEALAEANIPVDDDWLYFMPGYDVKNGYDMIDKILKSKARPTAIIAGSDSAAIGMVQRLHEAGISVPKDISIVAFDNTSAKYSIPPLTTIAQPLMEFGMLAVRLIEQKISAPELWLPQKITLQPSLVVRNSVARSK